MAERYFLVIRCLKDKRSYPMLLSAPPDDQISPLGIPQFDKPCLRHNTGVDAVSHQPYYSQHPSPSILLSLSGEGDVARLKEILVRKLT